MRPIVLIVDDDPAIRAVLGAIVGSHGYVVATANSGEAARCLVGACRPQLVILDAHLPDSDGPTLYAHLLSVLGVAILPTIWITAHGGMVAQLPTNHPQMVVLTKPFALDSVVRWVAELLAEAGSDPHDGRD